MDGDVAADPLASKFLRRFDGRRAAAEGVEDDIAFVGRSADDAVKQGEGFLRGVT